MIPIQLVHASIPLSYYAPLIGVDSVDLPSRFSLMVGFISLNMAGYVHNCPSDRQLSIATQLNSFVSFYCHNSCDFQLLSCNMSNRLSISAPVYAEISFTLHLAKHYCSERNFILNGFTSLKFPSRKKGLFIWLSEISPKMWVSLM